MKIKNKVIKEIIIHSQRHAPIEACGYLAAKDGVIIESYALTNVNQSSEHFAFDPKEQFAVLKNIRQKGLIIYAVYHSHPKAAAKPSDEDIRLAYDPDIAYFIVSLANGKEDVRAFKINNQKHEVRPINLEVITDERL